MLCWQNIVFFYSCVHDFFWICFYLLQGSHGLDTLFSMNSEGLSHSRQCEERVRDPFARYTMKLPKDYIIFPLDLPSYDQAMTYVDKLKDHVGLFKVGLELFISQGPNILKSIHDAGDAGIFLDLKLHDIPATVQRAFVAASQHEP
jgi:hypothetical protein